MKTIEMDIIERRKRGDHEGADLLQSMLDMLADAEKRFEEIDAESKRRQAEIDAEVKRRQAEIQRRYERDMERIDKKFDNPLWWWPF